MHSMHGAHTHVAYALPHALAQHAVVGGCDVPVAAGSFVIHEAAESRNLQDSPLTTMRVLRRDRLVAARWATQLWIGVLVAICILFPHSSCAKRGKKGKSKKQRVQGPTAPVLSAEQRAAQDQRVHQGMQLAATGRLADAEKAFGAALRVEPTNYAALGNRALLLPQMGRAAEGVAALEDATLLYPSDPSIPYNLGTLQASLGQDTDAVSQFLSAHKLASTGAQTGDCHLQLNVCT